MLNKLKQLGGDLVDKVKTSIKKQKEESEQQLRLKEWQDKLGLALDNGIITLRDEREMIYLGTHDVDKNINSKRGPNKKANNVVNLVLEFVETNVDATIPQPAARTKLKGYENQAAMIEDSLTADITELGITNINDVNERITPIQGFSAMLVGWNPDFRHHLYMGELTVESIHPKRIIPQPGVWDIQKMDYFFIVSSVTKSFIKKRYNVDLENQGEQFPGLNSLDGNGTQPHNEDMVTEIVCWYKNEDGEISKFVWCDNDVLEDLPNFFARRIDGKIQEFEVLGTEVTLADGEVLPAGTEVPYFKPTRYPLIIRENIPLNFAFGGQSDVDVVRDQQDAMKKVVSTIEEKIVRGSAIITALEGHRFNVTNELYSIIRGNQQELNALGVKTLQADISNDMAFAQQQYKAAQSTLGITNTYQGKADSTAVSGIAKQIQVQQTSGRLRSKEANKYAAFKELYQTMFEFKLAFYDELRPFVTKGKDGKDSFGNFDKYQFLVRDKAGELYYNTDFIFSADAGNGLPRDKMWLFNSNQELLKYGAFNPTPAAITFWTHMVQQKYPNAQVILDTIKKQIEAQSKKPEVVPKTSIAFKDVIEPEARAQILEKIGVKLNTSVEAQGLSTDNQITQGNMYSQPDIEQVIQEAMGSMTPEEQQAFMNAPNEIKIQILQEIMTGTAE